VSSASEKRDRRKLQITGGSTYILSLPKKWVTQMALKKGSSVALETQGDGSILVIPETRKKIEKPTYAMIEVASRENMDLILRKIVASYLVGYNTIIVKANNERLDFTLRSDIKNFVRKKLIGTEIIEDSPNSIMMEVLLSYPELSVERALRRMCIITSSMHRDVMKALNSFDEELAHEVIYMDDEVDRFGFYIIRQLKAAIEDSIILKEIGLPSRRHCLGYRLITKAVERTADHAVEIAENILMLRQPIDLRLCEPINSMSALAASVFNETIETIFKEDFRQANEIVQKAKQADVMRKGLMESILVREIEGASNLSLIIESITRSAEYASDIAEIVLNLNIEQNLA